MRINSKALLEGFNVRAVTEVPKPGDADAAGDIADGSRWINRRNKRSAIVVYTSNRDVAYHYERPLRKKATAYTVPFVQTARSRRDLFLRNFEPDTRGAK